MTSVALLKIKTNIMHNPANSTKKDQLFEASPGSVEFNHEDCINLILGRLSLTRL